MSLLSI